MILTTYGKTLVYFINPNPHCQVTLTALQEKVASLTYGKIITALYEIAPRTTQVKILCVTASRVFLLIKGCMLL